MNLFFPFLIFCVCRSMFKHFCWKNFSTPLAYMQCTDSELCAMYKYVVFSFFFFVFGRAIFSCTFPSFFVVFYSYSSSIVLCCVLCWFTLMFLLYVTFKNQKLTFFFVLFRNWVWSTLCMCRWLYFIFCFCCFFWLIILVCVLTVRLTYVRTHTAIYI